MYHDLNCIKQRIYNLLKANPDGRLTADEVAGLMPDLDSRQLTNNINKMVYDGVVKRIPIFGEHVSRYIVLADKHEDIGAIFEFKAPEATLPLHQAFGIAVGLKIGLLEAPASAGRLIVRNGVVKHRTISLKEPDSD